MATPRRQLVDEKGTPWYHCVSRCVRKAFLCGAGNGHRKDWILVRLRQLVEIFAIDCAGFAIMDNHLHLLLRLDSQWAQSWSDEEVARRWLTLFPVRDLTGKAFRISQNRVTELAYFRLLPATGGLDEPPGSRGQSKPRSANGFDLRATGYRVIGVGSDGRQVVRLDQAKWQPLRHTRAAQGGGAGASPPVASQPVPPRTAPATSEA